jgi:hypothetical protein
MAQVNGIVYTRAMLESVRDKKVEERFELFGEDIPPSLLDLIERNRLLELSGEYGDEGVDRPVEYEHLVVETDNGAVDIEVYNRGVLIFQYEETGELRRIHRVLDAILRHFKKY